MWLYGYDDFKSSDVPCMVETVIQTNQTVKPIPNPKRGLHFQAATVCSLGFFRFVRLCMHVCRLFCVSVHAYVYVCTPMHAYVSFVHLCMHVCCVSVRTCLYACVYVHACV
eukprot:scpid110659/ scgid19148/ 